MAVVLYHYTSHQGRAGIQQSGYVRPSHVDRARYGDGVYLTVKDPRIHSVKNIAENNFDNAWMYEGRINKVQVALEFQFSYGEVRDVRPSRGADVWVYEDGNLPLPGYFTGRVFVAGPDERYVAA